MRIMTRMRNISTVSILSSSLTLLAACTAPADPPPPSDARERTEVLAPIESAEIQIRESAPPQYALEIVSGLPSGCAQLSRIDVADGREPIEVTVWNSVPAADDVACTMIYLTTRNTVTLGSDFEPGRTYEVRVNGEISVPFTAQ